MVDAAPIAANRELYQLYQWFQSPDQCFRPWTWQVAQGKRVFPDKFNIGRIAFEHNVNPNYSENINFGYLDVGDLDLTEYGPIKVRFRNAAVSRRTTFLESNAYYFCHNHGVVDPTLMPAGFRATWDQRKVLAEAKLGQKVREGMTDDELRYLIIHASDAAGPSDFIEAHTFNPLHISVIESISGPKPSPDEQGMWDFVRRMLTAVGAKVEER